MFIASVILKYMEKNLDLTKPRYVIADKSSLRTNATESSSTVTGTVQTTY